MAAEATAQGSDPFAVMSDLVFSSPGTDVVDVDVTCREKPLLWELWWLLVIDPLEYVRGGQIDEQREHNLVERSRLRIAELFSRGLVLEMVWLIAHAKHHARQVNYLFEAAMFGSILDEGTLWHLELYRNQIVKVWILNPKSRGFRTSPALKLEASIDTSSPNPDAPPPLGVLNPNIVSSPRLERKLVRSTGQQPIGSRRRRAALQNSKNIPFEQLPYQCFQEARKLLLADREEKLKQIEEERRRIAKSQAIHAAQHGGEFVKNGRLISMQKYLEKLKILADINDPVIKKRFEDGEGDMNRPIYRFLADRQWRQQRRQILMQRINQMHIVPDVLPYLDLTAEVRLAFGRRNVQPGDFVDSLISETPPRLNVQVFDKGERYVSIVVVDPDVPNVETDGFDSRCHFLAVNIPISPTSTSVALSRLSEGTQVLRPWLPPHAQKGSPYHRMAIFIYEHGRKLRSKTMEGISKKARSGFRLRRFTPKSLFKPIGMHLFRTSWDDNMAGVMQRAGIEGANMEFRRKKPEKLPYKKKDGARYR
ncbi:MAG: hypothetical protein Q9173_003039 [Seirophora scorigena]